MEYPLMTFFLLGILSIWGSHEIFCLIYPVKNSRKHWPKGDIGFKSVDPDELFRRCEGEE
jgi:hypothetical protein